MPYRIEAHAAPSQRPVVRYERIAGAIQTSRRAVLSSVPRRSRNIMSFTILQGKLGTTQFERYQDVARPGEMRRSRRHIGWQWPCDCIAFARGDGHYLWVACHRHNGG